MELFKKTDVMKIYNRLKILPNDKLIQEWINIGLLFYKKNTKIEKYIFSMNIFILKTIFDQYFGSYKKTKNEHCDFRELIYNDDSYNSLECKKLVHIFYDISTYFNEHKKKGPIYHIITDIDDTIFPNHSSHHTISGSDYSDINKMPYSGILSFYNQWNKTLPNTYKYNTVLSATPTFMKQYRSKTYEYILGPNYSFVQGFSEVSKIINNIMTEYNTTRKISINPMITGIHKYSKFKQYQSLFLEYTFIFIGDNGQGDLIASKMMLESNHMYVFIHNIMKKNKEYKMSKEEINEEELNHKYLYFYHNYSELASLFYKLKLFNKQQMLYVKKDYEQDIELRKMIK